MDDDPVILQTVGASLVQAGYEVTTAVDGQEELEKVQTAPPGLVIVDLELPRLNGYSVSSTLKRHPKYEHIPIVVFTMKAQDSGEEVRLLSGADACVHKPFQPAALLETVRCLLAPSSTAPGAAR